MTLIVWVGNKNALAFAADSIGSVQHEEGMKWYIVNKLFELTASDPIWVATAWSSDFWWLLLEVIIKDFRKKLGGEKKKTLEEYINMFLEHLQSANYINGYNEKDFLVFLVNKFLSRVAKIRDEGMKLIMKDPEINRKDDTLIEKVLSAYISGGLSNDYEFINKQQELFGIPIYTEEQLEEELKQVPINILGNLFCTPDSNNYALLKKNILAIINKDAFLQLFGDWSELIFFGFWENDFFPKVCSMNLYYKVGQDIVFALNDAHIINWGWFIKAYAQSEDVENSILWIGDGIKHEICEKIQEKLTNDEKIGILSTEQHNAINNSISQALDEIRATNQRELSLSARFLSKTELWQIAENFVGIGSMKKRINLGNETIWWPIDVAIVTKSDGFIRIKRKHYFDPQKNYNYFNNLSKNHESSRNEYNQEGSSQRETKN